MTNFQLSISKFNSKTLKNIAVKSQILHFVFPLKLHQIPQIHGGKDKFQELLQAQYQMQPQYGRFYNPTYRSYKSGQYIQIRCRFCISGLKYKILQNGQLWKLLQFHTIHVHPRTVRYPFQYQKPRPFLKKEDDMLEQDQKVFMESNQSQKSENEVELDKGEQEEPSSRQKRVRIQRKETFNRLKKVLNDLDFNYKLKFNKDDKGKKNFPDRFTSIIPINASAYEKYGQIVCFNIVESYIYSKSFTKKTYKLAIFSGFDNNHRLVLFGLSLFVDETINDLKNIFRDFFVLMGYNHTNAFIIDKDEKIIGALDQLKYQKNYKYHLIYDNNNFLADFNKQLVNLDQSIRKDLSKMMVQIMLEYVPTLGKKYLHELVKILDKLQLDNLLKLLYTDYKHVCLWAMPNQFVGLLRYRSDKLAKIFRNRVDQDQSITEFLKIFVQVSQSKNYYQKKVLKYQSFQFEKFFHDPKILKIRNEYQIVAFLAFMENYKRSEIYQLVQFQNQIIIVRHFKFHISYKIINWECECEGVQKTGIPCEHIIFAFKKIHPQQDYNILINPWWETDKLILTAYDSGYQTIIFEQQ